MDNSKTEDDKRNVNNQSKNFFNKFFKKAFQKIKQ